MINEINKGYNKVDVLTILHSDPKILNRLVIAYFKKKGLYEEYHATRGPRSGDAFRDWTKGSNAGRYLDLIADKSGKGDLAYGITIGFDGAEVYIQVSKPGTIRKEYNFSIAGLSVGQLMDKIWQKMQSPGRDKEETQAKKEWKSIQNAVNKKFNKFSLFVNLGEGTVRFVFAPKELKSLFSDTKMRKALRDIYNPSSYHKEEKWMMKESLEEVKSAMKYIYMRMLKLGYFFYTYEGASMGSGDYVVFSFSDENLSAYRDYWKWEDAVTRFQEKIEDYEDIYAFYRKTIAKLFDPKVLAYWEKE